MNPYVKAILIIAVVGVAFFIVRRNYTHTPVDSLITKVSYVCDDAKTVTASYYEGIPKIVPNTDAPPMPSGSVALVLSDGRTLTLTQTISADGARYASADESIVFWSKGNGLIFTEKDKETYTGCVAIAPDSDSLPHVYVNATQGFSVRYPLGYTVDDAYTYQALGPSKDIKGIKFTIASSTAKGTNLASDSYVSIENSGETEHCSATLFLGQGATVSTTTESDATYSLGSVSDAGAGNRYEETVYAFPGTNPCRAVRYFIHYGAFENYPAGSIKEFDKKALVEQFDSIRHTLILGQ